VGPGAEESLAPTDLSAAQFVSQARQFASQAVELILEMRKLVGAVASRWAHVARATTVVATIGTARRHVPVVPGVASASRRGAKCVRVVALPTRKMVRRPVAEARRPAPGRIVVPSVTMLGPVVIRGAMVPSPAVGEVARAAESVPSRVLPAGEAAPLAMARARAACRVS
jgi:hypothetical protein